MMPNGRTTPAAGRTASTTNLLTFATVDGNTTDADPDQLNNGNMHNTGTTVYGQTKERIRGDMTRLSADSAARHRVPTAPTPTTTKFSSSSSAFASSVRSRKNKLLHRWSDASYVEGLDEDARGSSSSDQQEHRDGARAHGKDKKRTSFDYTSLLPCWAWLGTYHWKSNLWKDVIAGITVGVMIVPQSMSYAKLAGLPVEYGLYSSLMPLFLYGCFGTSRQLAVGPVALISLLLATGLDALLASHNITADNTEPAVYTALYGRLAIQTSALVGVLYIAMGLCRLGFVTIFLSHPVISGFTTGAAVIIGMSQLQYFLGYPIEKSDKLQFLCARIVDNLDEFNYKTFLVGTVSTCLLLGLKYVGKHYSNYTWVRPIGPLVVTIIGIVLQLLVDLDAYGIPVVGNIPKGLPSLTVTQLLPIGGDGTTIGVTDMLPLVVSITIVGFMESIAIAKQLAQKHQYEVDASKELIGLGMANLFGSGCFQGYPITGSFSRSAVNTDSGAQSGLAGIVTAILVMFVLLFLTPVFQLLPLAVLASIVVSGIIGLIDYPEAIHLWKVHKFDFMTWMIAFLGTLFLGVEIGLAIAVGVSLLVVLYESAYPSTSIMGRLPGTNHYRNVKQYPDAECYDGIVVVQIDAPIYFANTQHVRDKIRKYEERANTHIEDRLRRQAQAQAQAQSSTDDDEEQQQIDAAATTAAASTSSLSSSSSSSLSSHVKYLIIELSSVSHVDTSAIHILDDMHTTYKSAKGIQLCFVNPNPIVMEKFVKSNFINRVGTDYFFVSIQDAIDSCFDEMDALEKSGRATQATCDNDEDDDDDDDNSNDDGNSNLSLSLSSASIADCDGGNGVEIVQNNSTVTSTV